MLVDGAQGAVHLDVDVRDLDADFYVFTGHKVYGPTGIGVLYGKREWLERMPPYQGGGEMIDDGALQDAVTYDDPPHRFEAGTPPIVEAIGLGAALRFMMAARPRAHPRARGGAVATMRTSASGAMNSLRIYRPRQGQGRHHLLRDEGRACP